MPYNQNWNGWRRFRKPTLLCPSCLAANEPGCDFCRKCATPITTYAEIDPMGQIYSRGDMYRKAIAHPSKIGLIGLWLICGPMLLGCLGGYAGLTVDAFQPESPTRFDGMAFLSGTLVIIAGGSIFGCILYRATRNYILAQKNRDVEPVS